MIADAFHLWLQHEERTDDITCMVAFIDSATHGACPRADLHVDDDSDSSPKSSRVKSSPQDGGSPLRSLVEEEAGEGREGEEGEEGEDGAEFSRPDERPRALARHSVNEAATTEGQLPSDQPQMSDRSYGAAYGAGGL